MINENPDILQKLEQLENNNGQKEGLQGNENEKIE